LSNLTRYSLNYRKGDEFDPKTMLGKALQLYLHLRANFEQKDGLLNTKLYESITESTSTAFLTGAE
jgi:hypothetical protein